MESGNSWFLLLDFTSTGFHQCKKEERKATPNNRSFLLNLYLKKHFKMKTVKSICQSIMANGWAVSRDLTDVYSCSDSSEIQKIPSVRLQTSGFLFMALPFEMSLNLWNFHKLMSVIATKLRLRAVSLFPYLDNWLIRDLIRNRLI